jgi:hypothetical protein
MKFNLLVRFGRDIRKTILIISYIIRKSIISHIVCDIVKSELRLFCKCIHSMDLAVGKSEAGACGKHVILYHAAK